MAQSWAFVDASHALNELSHALALLESENSSLRGEVDGFVRENAKLRELATGYAKVANYLCERWDECEYCELECLDEQQEKCLLGRLNDAIHELGIEVES